MLTMLYIFEPNQKAILIIFKILPRLTRISHLYFADYLKL